MQGEECRFEKKFENIKRTPESMLRNTRSLLGRCGTWLAGSNKASATAEKYSHITLRYDSALNQSL
jgi:hypothetical protein